MSEILYLEDEAKQIVTMSLFFQGTFSLIIEAYHENHIIGK